MSSSAEYEPSLLGGWVAVAGWVCCGGEVEFGVVGEECCWRKDGGTRHERESMCTV